LLLSIKIAIILNLRFIGLDVSIKLYFCNNHINIFIDPGMSKNFNQPHQSNLFEESKSYVKFTREGATELVKNVTSADYLSNDCSYRQYKDSADHRAFH
jgi:hypothetical protein